MTHDSFPSSFFSSVNCGLLRIANILFLLVSTQCITRGHGTGNSPRASVSNTTRVKANRSINIRDYLRSHHCPLFKLLRKSIIRLRIITFSSSIKGLPLILSQLYPLKLLLPFHHLLIRFLQKNNIKIASIYLFLRNKF